MKEKIVFFDIETTGLDVRNDRIVEITLWNYQTDERITRRINPAIHIPKEASDVHGITDEMVETMPFFKDVAEEVMEFIDGCALSGFNIIKHDVPLLYYEFQRAGLHWNYKNHQIIDIGNLYKILEPRTLEAAYRFYCGDSEDVTSFHDSAFDVYATIRVFEEMLKRYDDIPGDIGDLSLFSCYDKKIVDLSGCFVEDENGDIVFNFGKHRGERAIDSVDYLRWMLGADFADDTKMVIYEILESLNAQAES